MATKIQRSPIFGKIWAVCDAGTVNRIIQNVLVRKGQLIATDGYIIAVRNIPKDSALYGQEALIPATVAKKLTKETEVSVTVGDEVKTPSAIYPIDTNGYTPDHYPRWEQVMPDPDNLNHLEVSINAEYLKRLADAISNDGIVTLRFSDDRLKAIHVKGNEGYGAIMPVKP